MGFKSWVDFRAPAAGETETTYFRPEVFAQEMRTALVPVIEGGGDPLLGRGHTRQVALGDAPVEPDHLSFASDLETQPLVKTH